MSLYNGYVNQLEVLKKPEMYETERSVSDIERLSLPLEHLTLNTVDKIENLNCIKTSSK